MYPVIAALHALLFARKKFRGTLALFIPAAIFSAIHYFFIPKTPGDYYAIIFDQRLPQTFFRYFSLSLGPVDLGRWVRHAHRPAVIGIWLMAIAVLLFSIGRLRRREYLPLFCAGWFLILIAPVLPLPNHVFDYYVTLPELGLAWLGGWAIASGLRAGAALRVVTIGLGALYLGGSALAIDGSTGWFYDHSIRVRTLVLGLQDAARRYPNDEFLLSGVDNDLFRDGVEDNPFRLLNLKEVYLIPDSEGTIRAREDLGGITPWVSSPQSALHAIERGHARVYQISADELRDITAAYGTILSADPRATRIDFVDAGDPSYAEQLGPTWYAAEQGLRWMPKAATVRMTGPATAAAKLYVTGYVPPAIVAAGPLRLTFRAAGEKIGDGTVSTDGRFAFEFPLPAALAGEKEMEVAIEASRVVRPATDPRDFGAAFGTFAIR
jgi:hypothetical protein